MVSYVDEMNWNANDITDLISRTICAFVISGVAVTKCSRKLQ